MLGSVEAAGTVRTIGNRARAGCLALVVTLLPGSIPKTTAAESGWQEAIKSSGCFATAPSSEQLLFIVSAWEGKTIAALLEQAGWSDIKQAVKDESFFNPDPLKAKLQPVIGRVLAATPGGLARFNSDMAAKNPTMCAIARYQANGSLEDVVPQQIDVGIARQPYLEVAQFVLRLQGCPISTKSDKPSGNFDNGSQQSWRRFANRKPATAGAANIPTPGQTVQLASGTYDPTICNGNARSNTDASAVTPFVNLFTKSDANCDDAKTKSDVASVAKAVRSDERLADALPYIACAPTERVLDGFLADARRDAQNLRRFVRAYLGARRFAKPDDTSTDGHVSSAWQSETLVPAHRPFSLADIPDLLWFTGVVVQSPPALDAVLEHANARAMATLGTILTEGLADTGKNLELGVRLFEAGAKAGSDFALLRTAQAYEQGYGVPADAARAIEYYRQLAERSQPAGFLALARLYEDGDLVPPDLNESARWYSRLLELAANLSGGGDGVVLGVAKAMQSRLIAGSAYLSSKEGLGLLESRADISPALAATLGDVFSCADCGGVVDLALATKLYRKAFAKNADFDSEQVVESNGGSSDHAYRFARLLLAKPELAQTPDEASKILADASGRGKTESALLRFYLEAIRDEPDEPALVQRLTKKMTPAFCDNKGAADNNAVGVDCVQFSHQLAIGSIDKRLVAFGYQYLSAASQRAFKVGGDDAAIEAFIDVLAYYGDFRTAKTLLQKSSITILESSSFKARTAVIARLLAQQPSRKTDRLLELQDFIQLSAKRGQKDAAQLLEILKGALKPVSEKADVAQASVYEARYREQAARGGVSAGLVSATRQYSRAEFAGGNASHAVELELVALNAEIYLEDVATIFKGPLPGALARVCLYAKSSRRVFELGDASLSLVLAKTAVNELQSVRKDVRSLPQQLQLCFAELVSNHYRWLADLLIQQNRNAEAVKVLGFLKNFETYDFLDRDDRFQGNAFDTLRLSTNEANSQNQLKRISTPAAELGLRERQLLLRSKQLLASNRTVPEAEQRELTQVRSQIAFQAKQTADLLKGIQVALKASDNPADAVRLELGTIQGRLRNEYAGKAVAIHYVILPDRMSAILTIPQGAQVSYTWDTLDGAPFNEQALNQKIVEFRSVLQKRSKDPVPLAQSFYKLLIAPFQKELDLVNPTTVLVSPDRKLGLLPFAALHDGKKYFAETVGIVMMTPVQPPSRHLPTNATISAFGITKAFPGFAELPNVKSELDGLVHGKSADGLFQGQEFLDQRFTRRTLASGMVFGTAAAATLGMVHIASHFKLGSSGSDSFLLLGDGDRLTVTEMRQNLGANREFDFGDVDLLTLSACETAYAQPQSDGRALESFATAVQTNGVRSVIGTLWPIADQSTPALMRQFYSLSTRSNMTRELALATAQRSLIGSAESARRAGNLLIDYSHPYYWAPFVLLQGIQ